MRACGDILLFIVVSLVALQLAYLSSADTPSCTQCHFARLDYNFCRQFENRTIKATLETDRLSYEGANVNINARLSLNDDRKFYYRFCYTFDVTTKGRLIGCKLGESFAKVNYTWNETEHGEAKMVVEVYKDSAYSHEDIVACGTLNVTIAENAGVNLSVNAVDTRNNSYLSQDDHLLVLGNITFIPNATVTDNIVKLHYKYDFGDDSTLESMAENVTHYYEEEGNDTFHVDVFAVVNASLVYHDQYTNYIALEGEVENIRMVISNNDSIPEAVTVDVTISANGSLPITVCWDIEAMNISLPLSMNTDNITCDTNNTVTLNVSSDEVVTRMTFEDIGDFEFIGFFKNAVSNKTGRFPFRVVPNPCKNITHLLKECETNPNVTYFETDEVIYTGAQSDIIAKVDAHVAENRSVLYYSFCSDTIAPELVGWVSGEDTGRVEHTWTESGGGMANLLLQVFSSNITLDGLACATTTARIYTPRPGGITLDVQVKDDRNGTTLSTYSEDEDEDHYFVVGNITFLSRVNVTDPVDLNKTYYRYDFGDGSPERGYYDENNTHYYNDTGRYSYWVEAIAVINSSDVHHAKYEDYIILQEVVRNIRVQISNNNSVTKGNTVKVTISADGSLPIIVCWHIEKANSSQPNVTTEPTPSCFSNETSTVLNDSSSTQISQTFNKVGYFEFVANFENGVSRKMGRFKFKVVSGNNKVIVASTATAAVIVMAVLASVVGIILLTLGVYIPYRKFKNRFTETANFEFVELNERTSFWKKVKMKFWQFRDRLKGSNEKIGLVNLTDEVSSDYGSVPSFAPHNDL